MPKRAALKQGQLTQTEADQPPAKVEAILKPDDPKADETVDKTEPATASLEPNSQPATYLPQSDCDQQISTAAAGSMAARAVLQAAGHSRKLLGVHVSAAGGLENALSNAAELGCRSLALFVRNQRQWNAKPITQDTIDKFRAACKSHGYDARHLLPHGSYLMNPGAAADETLSKTRVAMLDEVSRCQALGIKYYNFHPGSTTGKISVAECVERVAATINQVLRQTNDVTLVIETMAGQGNSIGGKFAEIADIIAKVDDKSRVGVCVDTCHIFAAGYDIRSAKAYAKTMAEFDACGLFPYLCAVHLNDSKGGCGSRLDRHEHIGKGQIGSAGFGHLMNDVRFDGIPMILETPEGDYANEMQLLYGMQKPEIE